MQARKCQIKSTDTEVNFMTIYPDLSMINLLLRDFEFFAKIRGEALS